MGREIRRVPADFDWPLNKVWEGFLMPDELHSEKCEDCDGEGVNEATREIGRLWYDQEGFGYCGQIEDHIPDAQVIRVLEANGLRWTYRYGKDPEGKPAERAPWYIIGDCRRWCHDLTQDEVDKLAEEGRLYDFTHTWTRGEGWKEREDGYKPTAAEVNKWSQTGHGHDAINRWICVRQRAERLGVYGKCEHCKGEGCLWRDEEHKRLHEEWSGTGPPEGPAYQVWETVSEGSPVSPAFISPSDLAQWMVENDDSITKDMTYEQWMKFITDVQWAPSMVGGYGMGITC